MQLRTKVGAIAVACVASAALVAGPALASSHSSASSAVTGPEFFAGVVHGKKALASSPVIPLRWQGLVATHSTVNLGGSGGPHVGSVKKFATPAGKLTVRVTRKPHISQGLNSKTCRFSFREEIVVTVLGGRSTGAFAGASGPGAVQVFFAANAPRFMSGPKTGQCNPNGQPIAKTAVASFLGSLVLTVR